MHSERRDLLLSVLFVAALFVPLLQLLFSPFNLQGVVEGRRKTGFPSLHRVSWQKFPARFDRYYEDNFGFRDVLIKLGNSIKFHLFGRSPTDQVLVGTDGWLFLTAGTRLQKGRAHPYLNDQQLGRLKQLYEGRQQYLAGLGIKYLLVVPPNKNTIYPEFYPDNIPTDDEVYAYDQFVGFMRANSSVALVDMKPQLLAGKAENRLYFRTDSHWNMLGAFIGYQQIARELEQMFPQIEELDRSDYYTIERREPAGLSRMLGIFGPPRFTDAFLKPKTVDLWYKHALKQRSRHAPLIVRRNFNIGSQSPPREQLIDKGIIYRDSFFARLSPFVSRHFVEVQMYSTAYYSFDEALIERERPSIVIEEFVERNIKALQPRTHDKARKKKR